MDRRILGLALVVALLGVGFAGLGAISTTHLPASTLLRAFAISLNRSYSDPASDVVKLWTSNMTPIPASNTSWVMGPFPSEVNILQIGSTGYVGAANVDLWVKVKSTIVDRPNVTYQMRLYTRADNSSHFIVTYHDGWLNLTTNRTGATVLNLTGNSTISPVSTLNLVIKQAILGNITSWNIDATATEIGSPYSYRDFGWDLPGNPGSVPSTFRGVVTDAGTNAPMAGVNVSADNGRYYTSTNVTGGYVLSVAPGTYNVTFRLSGYYPATRQASAPFGGSTTVSVQLQKLSVVDSMGIWFWMLLAVVIAAIAIVAFLVVRRRKPASPPKM